MPADAKRKAARQLKFGISPNKATNAEITQPRMRKRSRSASEVDDGDAASDKVADNSDTPDDTAPASKDPLQDKTGPKLKAKTKKDTAARYILFVGNLPFDATTAGVERHFASMKPTQVRHRTDKASGRSRGFAFVEFDSHARMDACLTRYHRSEYCEDPEHKGMETETDHENGDIDAEVDENEKNAGEVRSSRREGKKGSRRINVQLTAGGGGKSDHRRKRLREKNEKLDRERQKRRKKAMGKKAKKPAATADGVAENQESATFEAEEGMHPSRKARFARR